MCDFNEDEDEDEPSTLAGFSVIIGQLKSRPELAGRLATAGEYDKAKGRLQVHLLHEGILLLRPSSVSRATEAETAEDSVSTRLALNDSITMLESTGPSDPDVKSSYSLLGDIVEKMSVAVCHAGEVGTALLLTKTRAINLLITTLRAPDVTTVIEWRALRALRFLVRGDSRAIAIACRCPSAGRTPPAAGDEMSDASSSTAVLMNAPQLAVAALHAGVREVSSSASALSATGSDSAVVAEASRAKLRWGADVIKALSWDDHGAKACYEAGAADALARAMHAGARWAEVQLACVVAVRNLAAWPSALRALASEHGSSANGAHGATPSTLSRVVAALNVRLACDPPGTSLCIFIAPAPHLALVAPLALDAPLAPLTASC